MSATVEAPRQGGRRFWGVVHRILSRARSIYRSGPRRGREAWREALNRAIAEELSGQPGAPGARQRRGQPGQLTAEWLRKELEKRGLLYPDYVVEVLAAKLASPRKAFLLRGPAGTGKTSLAEALADILGAKLVYFQATPGSSEDDLLYKYIPTEETKSGIRIALGPLPLALEHSKNGPVVLLIDEFDKTRPSADALLLDFLQNYRLSLYLGGHRQIVTGNPENLIVFLTSNDAREFSEPLLRRLAMLEMPPLPTSQVYEILRKRFPDEVARLLAQIYDDTIKAELRKPATIQELVELGEVITRNPEIPLGRAIRTFIVKYDDDWDKFVEYVRERRPYMLEEEEAEGQEEDVGEYYKPEVPVAEESGEDEEQEEAAPASAGEILENLKQFYRIPQVEKKMPEPVEPPEEVTALVPMDEERYTKIVKLFGGSKLPESASKIGKFEVTEGAIIAREPLTIGEVHKLLANNVTGEYYFESVLPLTEERLAEAIKKSFDKVYYYSKDRVVAYKHATKEENPKTPRAIIEFVNTGKQVGGLKLWKVRGNITYPDENRDGSLLISMIPGYIRYSLIDYALEQGGEEVRLSPFSSDVIIDIDLERLPTFLYLASLLVDVYKDVINNDGPIKDVSIVVDGQVPINKIRINFCRDSERCFIIRARKPVVKAILGDLYSDDVLKYSLTKSEVLRRVKEALKGDLAERLKRIASGKEDY